MSRAPIQETSGRCRARPRAGSEEDGRLLAFQELEIPVQPLLSSDQEATSGSRIQSYLRRLAILLPRHPRGYRRILARMQWILSGGSPVYSWFSMRLRMGADFTAASQALLRAESWLEQNPALAQQWYAEGVETLRGYRLDPEMLLEWCRKIGEPPAAGRSPATSMDGWEESRKVDGVLQKLVRALERERDRLILPNLRLVLKEVFRYRPVGMKRSDLFQEGILGLHKAAFRFDARRGVRFSTYATYWIRQSIRRGLTDKSRLIRVPQAIQEALKKTEGCLTEAETDRLRRILCKTLFFSCGDSDGSRDPMPFDIEDPSVPQLSETLRLHRMPLLVQAAMSPLSSRQRDVLQRRFGLSGERPQTLEEIGAQLHLSRERIRQIEQEAIVALRRSHRLLEVYEDLQDAGVTAAATHG